MSCPDSLKAGPSKQGTPKALQQNLLLNLWSHMTLRKIIYLINASLAKKSLHLAIAENEIKRSRNLSTWFKPVSELGKACCFLNMLLKNTWTSPFLVQESITFKLSCFSFMFFSRSMRSGCGLNRLIDTIKNAICITMHYDISQNNMSRWKDVHILRLFS